MEQYNLPNGAQPSLQLDDLNEPENATKGQRFLNLLIDYLLMYLLIFVGGGLYGALNSAAIRQAVQSGQPVISTGMSYLSGALLVLVYYTLIEGLTKGRSLGKLVSRTQVLNAATEKPIGFDKALVRSIIRLVPFEVFSGFGNQPWHDSWSGTVVVKKK
ncbi:Uncharacterized membrane protein YckC, RDD family [Chitinophaga costaii]|uniref:Uncharacterized membrane protein YckC, RDD family n=1 Tax=Chitinophaga costaii TaxID=1335309 RepID=A0A1C4G1B5_9BACT|nr:RDD family protein [Chitinophaga costaii]PUZ19939.1 RDD family protein [Chitinophaga costaii]SCC61926.1 Uncharacterized membrane protein YckC, RDD family [Chitinophaga costaii]